MKEYVVLGIKCRKNLKITDIYAKIKETVKYNKNFFAFQNLKFDSISENVHLIYNNLNLKKFEYKIVLEHLLKAPYYTPEKYDRQMISNIDSRWEWHNENTNDSLSELDLATLVEFCDKLKVSDISTLILGFDEIEWNENKVDSGTYGFKKADPTYELGKNYLSNSIIIGRTYESKIYSVYISCERHFRELNIINELAEFFGNITTEVIHFAPSDNNERQEWNETALQAEEKFKNAILGLRTLKLKNIEKKAMVDETQKVNIKKYIKKHICSNGWELRKSLPDEWPTIVHKTKGDNDICLSFVSSHNGHHLQSLVYYRSKKFFYGDHIHDLFFNEIAESDMETYFYNAQLIRDYLYDVL